MIVGDEIIVLLDKETVNQCEIIDILPVGSNSLHGDIYTVIDSSGNTHQVIEDERGHHKLLKEFQE